MGMYHPHDPVTLDASKDGRTKQSFADESNINTIMKKYEATGMLDHLNKHDGQYANFIAAPDYHTAMNAIRDAGEMFMEIPATIRAKFDNDPAQFLKFVQDPDNLDEMREMGLAHRAPEQPDQADQPSEDLDPPKTPKEPPAASKTPSDKT